ncbi:MAG TPA: peptidoglycan editing factor PgeF [Aestuariivirgaceae bacterium]|jgi:YfiH family protein
MIVVEALTQISGLAHGFFTRQGGCSHGLFSSLNCGLGSGDDREKVTRNRATVADALGVEPAHLLTVYQEHSPKVITVAAPWLPQDAPAGDAMVTREPGLALGALTADCAPIIFADRSGAAIGVAHAGWKGALSGVTDATISAMEALGARRANIIAVIGPAISAAAYEVGPEFRARFLAADGANGQFFIPSPRENHSLFDLPAYLAARLRRFNIAAVTDLALCTYKDEARFFSYRRATHRGETQYGRLVSAIAIAH